MFKQNSLYGCYRIGKSQLTQREVDTAQTELKFGWESWIWNLVKVRWTKKPASFILNLIMKCVSFSRTAIE